MFCQYLLTCQIKYSRFFTKSKGLVGHKWEERPLVLWRLDVCSSSVGEFEDVESGVGGSVGKHLYRSRRRGNERAGFQRETRKGDNI